MLKKEFSSNKKLYREIFLKTKDEFMSLVENLKYPGSCRDCNKCCTLFNVDFTPAEIDLLISTNNDQNGYWAAFKNHYIPYGYSKESDWSALNYDRELNYLEAKKISKIYVEKAKSFSENVTFYYCKHIGENDCQLQEKDKLVCKHSPQKLLTVLHADCHFNGWQEKVEKFLKKELSQQIYTEINKIDKYKEQFTCNKTGTCCRLSSSEHSYDQLLEKARAGDKFATEFTSVFKPYSSLEEARAVFPEYVDYVLSEFADDEEIYFYQCPHIDDNNLCTIYEDRPGICSDFPSNPLSIMFPSCGYIKWKEETIVTALTSHAMIEICMYTLDKLSMVRN